jgi:hypothetical protein
VPDGPPPIQPFPIRFSDRHVSGTTSHSIRALSIIAEQRRPFALETLKDGVLGVFDCRRKSLWRFDAIVVWQDVDRKCLLDRRAMIPRPSVDSLETIVAADHQKAAAVFDIGFKRAQAPEEETDLNTQTQKAAAALKSAEYDGKIVVVVWEHRHIANAKSDTTFWKLLNLDQLPGSPGVPDTWSGGNYDYFWIVDYAPGNPKPVQWRPVKQVFSTPYTSIPANEWGDPEPNLPGCK